MGGKLWFRGDDDARTLLAAEFQTGGHRAMFFSSWELRDLSSN